MKFFLERFVTGKWAVENVNRAGRRSPAVGISLYSVVLVIRAME